MDDPREAFENLFKKADGQTTVGYRLRCKNERCIDVICLPGPVRMVEPETSSPNTYPPPSPKERSPKAFLCKRCGTISAYDENDLELPDPHEYSKQPLYAQVAVYRVEFPCAEKHCRTRHTVHVSIGRDTPVLYAGGAQSAIRALREGYCGGVLSCGHSYSIVLERFYESTRVSGQLW